MSTKVALISIVALAASVGLGYSFIQNGNATTEAETKITTSVLPERKQDIEQIVREYLTENPEVIIDALRAYEQKQIAIQEAEARQSLSTYLPDILSGKHNYVTGAAPEKAKVAVIELFDYHCHYCKKATGTMQKMLKKKDVTVVFGELPILREESAFAAEIALAAKDLGKYEEYHFAMMKAKGILDKNRIEGIANSVGIDPKELFATHAANQAKYKASLDITREVAQSLGLGGTPAFMVVSLKGDYSEIIGGYNPEAIDKAITAARKAG